MKKNRFKEICEKQGGIDRKICKICGMAAICGIIPSSPVKKK